MDSENLIIVFLSTPSTSSMNVRITCKPTIFFSSPEVAVLIMRRIQGNQATPSAYPHPRHTPHTRLSVLAEQLPLFRLHQPQSTLRRIALSTYRHPEYRAAGDNGASPLGYRLTPPVPVQLGTIHNPFENALMLFRGLIWRVQGIPRIDEHLPCRLDPVASHTVDLPPQNETTWLWKK